MRRKRGKRRLPPTLAGRYALAVMVDGLLFGFGFTFGSAAAIALMGCAAAAAWWVGTDDE